MTARGRARRRGLALFVLCTAQFMAVLSTTGIGVALPQIQAGLGLADDELQWVVSVYLLAFGGFLLLAGRLGDLAGRRRTFVIGTLMVSGGATIAGAAVGTPMLLGGRALQGLGAALSVSTGLALVSTLPGDDLHARREALAAWGVSGGIAAAVGVTVGGVMSEGLGWRAILLMNVPIGLAIALAAPLCLGPDARRRGAESRDALGAGLLAAALIAGVLAIERAGTDGLGRASAGAALASALLLAAFAVRETVVSDPVVPLRLLRNRQLVLTNVVMALTMGLALPTWYLMMQYLQEVQQLRPAAAGIAYLPTAAAYVVGARTARRLGRRMGIRSLLAWGLVSAAVGLVLLALAADADASLPAALGPVLLVNFGQAVVAVVLTVAAMGATASTDSGLAAGLLGTSRMIGGAVGLALLTALAAAATRRELALGRAATDALAVGYQAALTVAALCAAAMLPLAALIKSDNTRKQTNREYVRIGRTRRLATERSSSADLTTVAADEVILGTLSGRRPLPAAVPDRAGMTTGMPTTLFHARARHAPAAHYNVPGLKAISHRVVTHRQSERLALYHATMESPLDYTFVAGQDLIFYQLEGHAQVNAGDEVHALAPHEALHIPGGVEIRHRAAEPTTMLIIWGPAPPSDDHEH